MLATTSRNRNISTASKLRMAFAISRKIIRSGRARWPYQLRTTTAKESSMRHLKFVINCALVFSSIGAFAQDSARTVQYHSQDIVPIRAKGKISSFNLQDISALSTTPDLKVIVEPADRSAIVAASGPPQFVPAAQLEQSRQQLAALQSHVEQAVDEYKSAYPTQLKFDYAYKANEAPFYIQSIYHDDKFTYIKTNAREKFSVYEMKDGKPNLVTYDLREGTYIIPKIMNSGYVELGKKKMEFTRKG